jgi:acylglycerol lipase
MRHEEGFFKGVRDADIYHRCWLPEGEPRAVLLIVHGLAEHCGRYANVVDHFVPQGYAVYGVDHIGHGRSDGTRAHVKRFADFIDVLKTYVDMVREWQPGRPVFMIGHSLGALIGAVYLLDHRSELAGAILSGPLVKVPDSISPLTVTLSRILSVLLPRLGVAGVDAEGVSRDPAVVDAYISDPLVHTGKTTARLGCEILRAMRRIADGAPDITLPLLVLQGSEDRLVPPDGAEMLYRAAGSGDKMLRIYDGLHHEIYNEPEHPRVLGDVAAWIEERLDVDLPLLTELRTSTRKRTSTGSSSHQKPPLEEATATGSSP